MGAVAHHLPCVCVCVCVRVRGLYCQVAGATGGPTVPIEAVPGSGVTKFKMGGDGPFIW